MLNVTALDPVVTIRPATPTDELLLTPLVRRAGEVLPRRPLAVAEEDGRIVAVRSLRDGVLVTPHREARGATLRALSAFDGGR